MIPLCAYSLDSLTLVKKCKGFIKFTELGKYEFNVKSVEDPIINLANESSYCVGYINGFLDSYSLAQEKTYCLPNPIEAYQVAKIYSKYLEEHPEKLHQNSNITFSEALIAYFPCKN